MMPFAIRPVARPVPDDAPVRLRADGRSQVSRPTRWMPIAVSPRARLSWVVPLTRPGHQQNAYQVQLHLPRHGGPTTVVDTGVIESDKPSHRLVEPLPAQARGSWRVRTRDEHDVWSAWSSPSPVETGPWTFEDWQADWISVPALGRVRIPLELEHDAVRARLHLTAQGLVRAEIDTVPVNGEAIDPSRTDADRALYRSYDVTDLCTRGRHGLDLTVARGAWHRTDLPPRVLATCVVELADGSTRSFGTTSGLTTSPSTVVVEEPFYLERHDLRVPDRFDRTREVQVLAAVADPVTPASPPRRVDPDPAPPLAVTAELAPVLVSTRAGSRVYDVGVNIAGRIRVRLAQPGPAGTVIRLVHGEHLGAAGEVDTTNLTLPHDRGRTRQVVEFVLAAETAVLESRFSYAGFRYVQIDGVPAGIAVDVIACTLHTDLADASTLCTDSPTIERLVGHGRRTLLNNVHGIPEDCPTREQAGWTGDTAAVAEFELSAFDVEGFFAKWLGDLRTSQHPDGAIPAISPSIPAATMPPDPVWGAALQRVLLGHWLHYGDRRVLEENLPVLRRWTHWLHTCVGAIGVLDGAPISYGHDWLGLQQTPPELHHTAAAIDAFAVLARLESDTGDPAAARVASEAADRLRVAARAAFVDPDRQVVGNGSQGSWAIALDADLLEPDERGWAIEALVSAVRSCGNRVTSGFATTRTVVRALAHADQDQVLADVMDQTAEPGVGAMLASDMGTFWECWWVDPTNTGTGSLDHVGLGGPFAGWAWQRLGGLQPLTAGFARFLLDPHPVLGVDRLRLTTHTVRGDIEVDWRRDGDDIDVDVTVPVSAAAVVPTAGGVVELTAGRHRLRLPRPATGRHPVASGRVPGPSWARRPADVDLDPGLDAHSAGQVHAVDGTVDVLPDGLRCMPVPHEQEPGPVLRVTGSSGSTETLTRLDVDLDLTDAVFGYARLDLCGCPAPGPLEAVLRLHAADGTTLTGTGRVWPAGWNRVSVDVGRWPGRSRVVAIDAGVRLRSGESTSDQGLSVHVGPIGFSRVQRTW